MTGWGLGAWRSDVHLGGRDWFADARSDRVEWGGRQNVSVRLPRKECVTMQRYRLIGGICFLIAAALVFFALESSATVPIAGGLAVVGIALIATSRRRAR